MTAQQPIEAPPVHSVQDERSPRRWWWRKRVWIPALVLVLLAVIGIIVGAVYGVRRSRSEYVLPGFCKLYTLTLLQGMPRATTTDCTPLKVEHQRRKPARQTMQPLPLPLLQQGVRIRIHSLLPSHSQTLALALLQTRLPPQSHHPLRYLFYEGRVSFQTTSVPLLGPHHHSSGICALEANCSKRKVKVLGTHTLMANFL